MRARNATGSGKTRWFANTMTGVVQDGSVVNLWGVQRDITDRKKAEMTLRESEEQVPGTGRAFD